MTSLRRSSTLPSRAVSTARYSLGSHESPTDSPSASDEILYSSPSAKIFKFELPDSSSSSPILPDLDYPVDAIETLPWKLSTERLASIGPLKIENVAGSATFLKSGSVVYPLLKNSQCWCVDQVSRFVFRIRKLTYYRVELPGETEEDKGRVESFKEVLSSIIRYEITPCPFKRGFSVILPEEAKTPKKKKAWQPKRQSMPAFPPLNLVTEYSSAATGNLESTNRPAIHVSEGKTSHQSRDKDTENDSPAAAEGELFLLVPDRIRTDSRRVTAPPHTFQSLVAKFQEFQDASIPEQEHTEYVEDSERMSSLGSFHTCETDTSHSPLDAQSSGPPSPWHSSPGDKTTAAPSLAHGEDVSDPSSLPESDPFLDSDGNDISEIPEDIPSIDQRSTPTTPSSDTYGSSYLSSNEGHAVDDPNPDLRRRLRINRKRELSPLPPPSTLYYPSARSPANHLTHSIMKKTCTYVLGPPVQFLMLLLRLAAKIAASRPSPTSPDSTDPYSYQKDLDDLSEDDFGIPISSRPSLRQVNSNSLSVYDSLDEAD